MNLLKDCLVNKEWFKVECLYCETSESIYRTWKRHHGCMKDVTPKSRLRQTTEFIKDHYRYNKMKHDEIMSLSEWRRQEWYPEGYPDCESLRGKQHLDKPFKIATDDQNLEFDPKSKEWRALVKEARDAL